MSTEYDLRAFGDWVRQSRLDLRWKPARLAQKLAVHRGTLKHFEDADRSVNRERRQAIVDLLIRELAHVGKTPDRRAIHMMTGLPLGAAPSHDRQTVYEVHVSPFGKRAEIYGQFLNIYSMLIDSWGHRLFHGSPQDVLKETRESYYRLLDGSQYHQDFDIALLAARVGIRLGQAKEAVYDWFSRSRSAISTYDQLEDFVIIPALDHFRSHPDVEELIAEHARLIALRAPLYREMGEYDTSIHQAEIGAELAGRVADTVTSADLLRNRAHVMAVQGRKEAWEEALAAAHDAIDTSSIHARGLQSLHLYHIAEGNRRLAFNHRIAVPLAKRQAFAEAAIIAFSAFYRELADASLDEVAVGSSRHLLIPRVSEAQCLMWLNPQEAADKLAHLRQEALREHPSLVGKIDFSSRCTTEMLAWKCNSPLPVFDLDANYRR